MNDRISDITGKTISSIQDYKEHEKCEFCGGELISNCWICGAPVCCMACCVKEMNRRKGVKNEQ